MITVTAILFWQLGVL